MSALRALAHRAALPAAIFALTALVYVVVAGPRTREPSPNNHFVHLASSMMEGQLAVLGDRPPGYNDWACFDVELGDSCRPDAFQRPRESQRWYVSFPPLPAVVILPAVAVLGPEMSDPLFWAIFAGLAPSLLYVLLRHLRERKVSPRRRREDLVLVAVFAFGSIYFSTAVQGSVWFAAHVVASALLCLFLLFALDARRPFWAGLMLGLCFLTRPTMLGFGLLFLIEALRVSREITADVEESDEEAPGLWTALGRFFVGVRWVDALKRLALFSAPVLAVGAVAMAMNDARFDDPFEFGHRFLQIRWRPRIERWGLFNYHYLSKNLAVFLASLPWISAEAPYLKISRHGLAAWLTMPNFLPAFWPKKVDGRMVALFFGVAAVAIWDLCYQNSGWVQFGYRFSLDYLPALVVLLALSRRRFGPGFFAVLAFAIAINLFGAITFDRAHDFYDDDLSQDRLFHPD